MHTRFISGSRSDWLISCYPESGTIDPPLAVQPGVLKSSAYKLLHISDQTTFMITNPSRKQKPVIHVLALHVDIYGLQTYPCIHLGRVNHVFISKKNLLNLESYLEVDARSDVNQQK